MLLLNYIENLIRLYRYMEQNRLSFCIQIIRRHMLYSKHKNRAFGLYCIKIFLLC